METEEKGCYNVPKQKTFDELTFMDDFMFSKVMLDPEICKKVLELILDVEIDRVEYPERQKSIDARYDAKGIRLDVYVKGADSTVYNVEMQTTDTMELPKRTRYYQGLIDMDLLQKGRHYSELGKSYVIFICPFDLFGQDEPVYHFENLCIKGGKVIHLEDESYKVFVNTTGKTDSLSEEQQAFFRFMGTQEASDVFTKSLEDAIADVKASRKWRREYMTFQMKLDEERRQGIQLGMQKGMQIGEKQGKITSFFRILNKGFTVEEAQDMSGLSKAEAEEALAQKGTNI